jgi:hypothetical protein
MCVCVYVLCVCGGITQPGDTSSISDFRTLDYIKIAQSHSRMKRRRRGSWDRTKREDWEGRQGAELAMHEVRHYHTIVLPTSS